MRSRLILPGLAALLAICCLLALSVGSVHVPLTETFHRFWAALWGRETGDLFDAILFQTRLPRIILAAAVGASLALAGVAAQSLFQNPLAGPHVIGVSNGAALGAVAGMLIFAGRMGGNYWVVTLCSSGRRDCHDVRGVRPGSTGAASRVRTASGRYRRRGALFSTHGRGAVSLRRAVGQYRLLAHGRPLAS